MWFVKPGTDPSEGDRPPTVEVPLHNSNNQFELNIEKLVDRTSGADQTEQTVYHAEMRSNTQKLYHEAPQKNAFNGQFAWTEFKFRMNPQAPVTTTTKRNRGYADVAAELGGLWYVLPRAARANSVFVMLLVELWVPIAVSLPIIERRSLLTLLACSRLVRLT